MVPADHLHEASGMLEQLFRPRRAAVGTQSVAATGDMRDMPHGAFRRTAEARGGDVYRVELPLEMPGVWDVTLQIVDGLGKAEVRLSIDVPS